MYTVDALLYCGLVLGNVTGTIQDYMIGIVTIILLPQWQWSSLQIYIYTSISWWRHQMETFCASLALCAGNSPVTGEFSSQRPVARSFDVFLDLRLINGWVNNREAGDLGRHHADYYVTVILGRKLAWISVGRGIYCLPTKPWIMDERVCDIRVCDKCYMNILCCNSSAGSERSQIRDYQLWSV